MIRNFTDRYSVLIVLKRFSPPDAFDASGSVGNSVSELLSNQLGYWMSQVDENLEIRRGPWII